MPANGTPIPSVSGSATPISVHETEKTEADITEQLEAEKS